MPEASIRHEVLSVSFDGSGMYSLYIEDSFGTVVYQSMLPADGMEYDYDLSGHPSIRLLWPWHQIRAVHPVRG